MTIGCTPPPTDNIQQYLDQVIYCTKCSCKLDGSQVYFKSKEVADYILCETCMYFSKKHRNKKDFEQVEPTKMPLNAIIEKEDFHKLESLGVDPELTKMVDEYYGIDFEDVIAGGLKTRFKYMAIKGDDFNLDDGDLVFADDRILNRYLSVKKLAPYRQVE